MKELILRPFYECFDRGSSRAPLQIKGEIQGQQFAIVIDQEHAVLATLSVGRDNQGDWASVEPNQRVPIGHQWLYIKAQLSGDEAVGAEISVGGGMEQGLMTAGAFTLFLDVRGLVEGQGVVRPASEPPVVN